MKRLTFILVSLMCFSCTTKETPVAKYTGSDISDVILARIITDDPYNDESLFRQIHADEIKKTFTLNSVDTVGNLSVAFFSFSIGNESVKDVMFINKLNGSFAITRPAKYNRHEKFNPDQYFYLYDEDDDMAEKASIFYEKQHKTRMMLSDRYGINNEQAEDKYTDLLNKADRWKDQNEMPWWYDAWWYDVYLF